MKRNNRLGLEPIGSRTHYKVWSTNSFPNDNWGDHHAGTHAGGKRAPRRTQARLTGFSDGEQNSTMTHSGEGKLTLHTKLDSQVLRTWLLTNTLGGRKTHMVYKLDSNQLSSRCAR